LQMPRLPAPRRNRFQNRVIARTSDRVQLLLCRCETRGASRSCLSSSLLLVRNAQSVFDCFQECLDRLRKWFLWRLAATAWAGWPIFIAQWHKRTLIPLMVEYQRNTFGTETFYLWQFICSHKIGDSVGPARDAKDLLETLHQKKLWRFNTNHQYSYFASTAVDSNQNFQSRLSLDN
jgi:hypothetical protein